VSWLVTGGAGYIGAHVVHAMVAAGERVVVLDDLSTGDAGRLAELPSVPLVVGSVRDRGLVCRVLREHAVQGVVHVAGKKQVAESVADPLTYYAENVDGLRVLLEQCVSASVRRFVFSSSAAVYGSPDTDPVGEDAPCRPLFRRPPSRRAPRRRSRITSIRPRGAGCSRRQSFPSRSRS